MKVSCTTIFYTTVMVLYLPWKGFSAPVAMAPAEFGFSVAARVWCAVCTNIIWSFHFKYF
ncbi:hypothetical protein BJ165DRAFT_1494437 [Panaeolus papilionaceus]|nr:hypothetical protein BJ165DRAFT_1494437 [Panaeolus papilionaceus]